MQAKLSIVALSVAAAFALSACGQKDAPPPVAAPATPAAPAAKPEVVVNEAKDVLGDKEKRAAYDALADRVARIRTRQMRSNACKRWWTVWRFRPSHAGRPNPPKAPSASGWKARPCAGM